MFVIIIIMGTGTGTRAIIFNKKMLGLWTFRISLGNTTLLIAATAP